LLTGWGGRLLLTCQRIIQLVASTAWTFGPEAMDQRLDCLFIDEAGQVALPHAIAAMISDAVRR
jgi:superfamily I DNA and/or RNA helicase